MPTRWNRVQHNLKERDLVRMHFDVPNELRYQLRLAAVQDGKMMREIYIDALTDYLRDRKIQRATDPNRAAELKLDLKGLEDL